MRQQNKYTLEFKQEAVRLVEEKGYSQAEAARNLAISSKNLNRWIHEGVGAQCIKPRVPVEQAQQELQTLRKENKRLLLERDILKKAAAFFAKESH